MAGYKVQVKTIGDKDWCGNALVFSTEEKATAYGEDLFNRWVAVEHWRVVPTEEEPNRE